MTRLVIRDRADLREWLIALRNGADNEGIWGWGTILERLIDADYSALVETAHSGEQGCEDSRRLADWLEDYDGEINQPSVRPKVRAVVALLRQRDREQALHDKLRMLSSIAETTVSHIPPAKNPDVDVLRACIAEARDVVERSAAFVETAHTGKRGVAELRAIERAVWEWQVSGRMHPLTCGTKEKHHFETFCDELTRGSHDVLRPDIREGRVVLACPTCDYVQTWIPDVVTDAARSTQNSITPSPESAVQDD